MKIEIYKIDGFFLGEKTFDTGFYAPDDIKEAFKKSIIINGIVIIDNTFTIKFCFDPMHMDGDIFTDDPQHRTIIKSLIPTWYYTKFVKEES